MMGREFRGAGWVLLMMGVLDAATLTLVLAAVTA